MNQKGLFRPPGNRSKPGFTFRPLDSRFLVWRELDDLGDPHLEQAIAEYYVSLTSRPVTADWK